MRIVFAAKWASAASLLALSITAAMAETPLYPADVEGNDKINGRVEVYNLTNTRLPASTIFSCTNRGCEFVKLSIVVKPPETQIYQNITNPPPPHEYVPTPSEYYQSWYYYYGY